MVLGWVLWLVPRSVALVPRRVWTDPVGGRREVWLTLMGALDFFADGMVRGRRWLVVLPALVQDDV